MNLRQLWVYPSNAAALLMVLEGDNAGQHFSDHVIINAVFDLD